MRSCYWKFLILFWHFILCTKQRKNKTLLLGGFPSFTSHLGWHPNVQLFSFISLPSRLVMGFSVNTVCRMSAPSPGRWPSFSCYFSVPAVWITSPNRYSKGWWPWTQCNSFLLHITDFTFVLLNPDSNSFKPLNCSGVSATLHILRGAFLTKEQPHAVSVNTWKVPPTLRTVFTDLFCNRKGTIHGAISPLPTVCFSYTTLPEKT